VTAPMRHLNYNHLQYFWTVAREGSIVKAAEILHLTPQTISGQLKLLDETVGQPLFNRAGRGLVLSETGRVVFKYADEIFSAGAELASYVRSGAGAGSAVVRIGAVSTMPKLVVQRIVAPALAGANPVHVRCVEATLNQLLADLAIHRLDLVLSDFALPTFDGLSALQLLRERCPEVPFIVVTGSIGEETAVAFIKSGATDYVLKDRLDRLVPAVRTALERRLLLEVRRDAERRTAQAQERGDQSAFPTLES